MRISCTVLSALVLAGPVCSAPVRVPTTAVAKRAAICSVAQLRTIRLPAPRRVSTAGSLPANLAALGSAIPSGGGSAQSAYRVGDGVALRSNALIDGSTGSWCMISFALLVPGLQKTVCDATSEEPLRLSFPFAQQSSSCSFISATFKALPPGLHTYIVTLCLRKEASAVEIQPYLKLYVGGDLYEGSALTANSITGDYRVMFTYDPVVSSSKESLVISAVWTYGGSATLRFYHLQLAQLD